MGIHSLSDASFHDVNWKIRPVSIRPPSHYQVLLIFIWVIKVSVHDSSSTVNHPQLVGLTCCPHCSKVNRPRFGKFNQVSDLRFDIVFVDRSASNKPTQQGGWRKITSQIPKGQTVTSSWDKFICSYCCLVLVLAFDMCQKTIVVQRIKDVINIQYTVISA